MRFGSVLQTNWDWRAAGNFMLGGTGGALMFMTAATSIPHMPPPGLGYISLIIVALGLGLVWLEIGKPWRFLNVFFHPHTSWMSREASMAVLLFLLALAGILLNQVTIIALAGLAGLAFLYCQARILKAAKGIPAWREPAIVPFIIITALCEGSALLLLIVGLTTNLSLLNHLLVALIILRTWTWINYRRRLSIAKAPQAALNKLISANPLFQIAGNLLPVVLIGIAYSTEGNPTTVLTIAWVLILLSGWYIKFIIVTRAAHVQGFALGRPKKAPV